MTAEWITEILVIGAGCAVAWALWKVSRPRASFSIRVINGKPHVDYGTVTPAFLERLREVAAANDISRGVVSGYAHDAFIRLKFSSEIPEAARQQLRNWWASFGWTAPRTRETGRCG